MSLAVSDQEKGEMQKAVIDEERNIPRETFVRRAEAVEKRDG